MITWRYLRKTLCLPILISGMISSSIHAAMYVYPMETSVGENGTSQIRVISQDNEVQFVKIKLKQIINPATNKEREVDSEMSDASHLIVTPQKIALAAGGERVVRLVSINLPQKETTWRVYFEGVNEAAYNFTSGREGNVPGDAQVGVSIIWGVLVHVAPQKAIASMEYSPVSGKLINSGTIRIPVKELGTCRSASDCTWEKKELTLYPDSELAIPGVTFTPGNLYKIKYFNWIKNAEEVMELPAV
ncbi:fimbrial protein (plasmid) [Serratia ureilytica]|uniref:fimbrial protein n=1 Tax=Serratia ureilytica TaxID=300181 RepID=UPI00164EB17F|nr:fimbrial protein [Serratia ureilytica]QNL02983.1 fimbrial protein [Serratia ureilytica]